MCLVSITELICTVKCAAQHVYWFLFLLVISACLCLKNWLLVDLFPTDSSTDAQLALCYTCWTDWQTYIRNRPSFLLFYKSVSSHFSETSPCFMIYSWIYVLMILSELTSSMFTCWLDKFSIMFPQQQSHVTLSWKLFNTKTIFFSLNNPRLFQFSSILPTSFAQRAFSKSWNSLPHHFAANFTTFKRATKSCLIQQQTCAHV